MVVIDFDRFAARPSNRYKKTNTSDDISMATPLTGALPVDTEEEMKEITVRFDFVPKTADEATKVAVVHTHLLSRMQAAFSDECLVFDNKGAQLTNIDPINWTPIKHQSHFNIHVSQKPKRQTKYTIIHRLRTSQSLSTIRTYNTINSLLKEHNCYMKTHSWDETVWDVAQAGYLIGIDPKYYTPEAATTIVADMMAQKGHSKCPPLRMIYSSPRIFLNDRNISSKAYAIEFERKHIKEVLRSIKDAFAGTTKFLMARLRYSHPQSFASALKLQNKYMNETYSIPLLNTSPDEFFYLQPLLENTPNVIAVVPTRKSLKTGRYHILTHVKMFKQVRDVLITEFASYYNKVAADAKQNPEALLFLGPPSIQTSFDNTDSSSGDMSFLSTSAASFASFCDLSDTEDAYKTFTPTTNTYSWSDVAKHGTPQLIPSVVSTPNATATSASHATSVLTPSDIPTPTNAIQSLREEYDQKLQSNATQIAALTLMLTQVLSTLQNLGVQGVSNSIPNTPPLPHAPDVTSTDTEQNGQQLKRTGYESPPNQEATIRHKRPDTKTTPDKRPDFQQDE
jgi:hypothetical protein